jgi:hypothetical protein
MLLLLVKSSLFIYLFWRLSIPVNRAVNFKKQIFFNFFFTSEVIDEQAEAVERQITRVAREVSSYSKQYSVHLLKVSQPVGPFKKSF